MAESLSSNLYTDPRAYESERTNIFGREWMILGRISNLAAKSGYIAEEIAGYPIFVVVDAEGVPWAYHNVCPHRGGPIFFPGRGHADRLECQYHGWCFSPEGSVVDLKGFGDLGDTGRETLRLRDVSIGYWGGQMWVCLTGNVPALSESLGRMVDDCADIPFGELGHTAHVTREVPCNWKLLIENYLENYHVEGTHPLLSTHFDFGGSFVEVHEDTYTRQAAATKSGVPIRWFYRYPNVALQVLGDTLAWTQYLPKGPDSTLVVMDHFAPEGTDDTPLRSLMAATLDDDARICAAVHRNLRAGVHRSGPLSSTKESAVNWFDKRIAAAVDIRMDLY